MLVFVKSAGMRSTVFVPLDDVYSLEQSKKKYEEGKQQEKKLQSTTITNFSIKRQRALSPRRRRSLDAPKWPFQPSQRHSFYAWI